MDERLAIIGSGAIASGLAATAAHHGGGWGPVLLLARSEDSAERARASGAPRTPRAAHVSAYSARFCAVFRGIAPSELLIM